ncbi:MAG: pyridoxal-phosphate dependent enzyme [Gemmatimonadota bacterium]|nr:pyridoxal-phosphate dependent enzyme [Gemmatimonadota bacterium]
MRPLEPIPLEAVRAAAARIAGSAIRTPLVRMEDSETAREIWLKLENLQPIGSFKLRGALNAMALASTESLARGVYTASAGNMAQGVAWSARRLGVRCRVIVPERAATVKLRAIERLGGEIIRVPFDEWWQTIIRHSYPGMEGLFIHPVSDPAVIAGNGTIGLEILEDLPQVDAVVVPYGGGGLSCGIASVCRALSPKTRVIACEVSTAAPFSASLRTGTATSVEYAPSFVDGIGGKSVLAEMWPLARELLTTAVVVSPSQIAEAVRLLAEHNRVVAEGAGAAAVAAARSGEAGNGRIVCIVSGGNIDAAVLAAILRGELPGSAPPRTD